MLNKPQMPDTKTTFLPIDKLYMICKIQRVALPCDSTWPHIYHDGDCLFFPTFSKHSSCDLHACFFTLKWCCTIFFLSASGMFLSNESLSGMFCQIDYYSGFLRIRNHFFGYSLLFSNNSLLFYSLISMKIEICFLYKGFLFTGTCCISFGRQIHIPFTSMLY